MAELIPDAEGAGPDDLVLEVHRVEDARTVTQRLHIESAAWRRFLELPAPATAGDAYTARQDFWDWLAEEYADTAPGTPSGPAAGTPDARDDAWLREQHAAWQAHRGTSSAQVRPGA